jgi:hypothetical protein
MLSAERNRVLTQVGPATPMGDLLRRYWHPIGGASEFDSKPVKAIRLLGEDLTLYKDLSGTFGLVDRHCAHRRADLSYGFVGKRDCAAITTAGVSTNQDSASNSHTMITQIRTSAGVRSAP